MKETVTLKFCPQCKSTEIQAFAGGVTGTWQCKNCSFLGPIFPEKVIEIEEKERIQKKNKKLKINRKDKNGRRRKQQP